MYLTTVLRSAKYRSILTLKECSLRRVSLYKKMVADFYEVEERTIERYLEKHSDELAANGYVLCKGKHLKELKLQFAPVINVGSKTTQLGLFNFRSFLDMGMLLTESEKAKKYVALS